MKQGNIKPESLAHKIDNIGVMERSIVNEVLNFSRLSSFITYLNQGSVINSLVLSYQFAVYYMDRLSSVCITSYSSIQGWRQSEVAASTCGCSSRPCLYHGVDCLDFNKMRREKKKIPDPGIVGHHQPFVSSSEV